jgi:hypothetical protein
MGENRVTLHSLSLSLSLSLSRMIFACRQIFSKPAFVHVQRYVELDAETLMIIAKAVLLCCVDVKRILLNRANIILDEDKTYLLVPIRVSGKLSGWMKNPRFMTWNKRLAPFFHCFFRSFRVSHSSRVQKLRVEW